MSSDMPDTQMGQLSTCTCRPHTKRNYNNMAGTIYMYFQSDRHICQAHRYLCSGWWFEYQTPRLLVQDKVCTPSEKTFCICPPDTRCTAPLAVALRFQRCRCTSLRIDCLRESWSSPDRRRSPQFLEDTCTSQQHRHHTAPRRARCSRCCRCNL